MNRFFASIKDGEVFFSQESIHHLTDVLRAKEGDEFEVVIEGKVYEAKLDSLDPFHVSLGIEKEEQRESSLNLRLAFALLKGGHDDLLIQKCTEMGTKEFLPYTSERTIIQLKNDKEKEKRRERFQKIAAMASEQSKRAIVPMVAPIVSFDATIKENAKHKFIAYEGEAGKSNSLFSYLDELRKGDDVLILVGPEGGFSEKEVQKALDKGFKLLSLGRRILRAETSSMYISALISAKGDTL